MTLNFEKRTVTVGYLYLIRKPDKQKQQSQKVYTNTSIVVEYCPISGDDVDGLTREQDETTQESTANTGVLIGLVVGSIAVVAAIVVTSVVCVRYRLRG